MALGRTAECVADLPDNLAALRGRYLAPVATGVHHGVYGLLVVGERGLCGSKHAGEGRPTVSSCRRPWRGTIGAGLTVRMWAMGSFVAGFTDVTTGPLPPQRPLYTPLFSSARPSSFRKGYLLKVSGPDAAAAVAICRRPRASGRNAARAAAPASAAI